MAHFAAETNVDRSIENPLEVENSNVVATQNLLSLSVKYGVERFHHVSTDEVFGDFGLIPRLSLMKTRLTILEALIVLPKLGVII